MDKYHFDLVVPFERQIKLEAVSPDGRPIQGAALEVWGTVRGSKVPLVRSRKGKGTFTDRHGLATIRRLAPEEELTIVLRRLAPGVHDPYSPLASACVRANVPRERERSMRQVTFDERPIRIKGTVALPADLTGAKLERVFCIAYGLRYCWMAPVESGSFVLEGVPPGEARLGYYFVADGKRGWQPRDCVGTIHTQPGHTYVVKVVNDRVELVGKTQHGHEMPAGQQGSTE